MSLHRRAAKRDRVEPAIVEALEACGWTVLRVSVKDGPDLFAARAGRVISLEVKTGRKPLREGQKQFAERWQGPHFVVRSVDEATRLR